MPHWIRAFAIDEAALRRARRHPGFIFGGGIVALVLFAALAAPWLAPVPPEAQDLQRRLERPGREHPFGTDELGRDILARVLYGARVSVQVGFIVVGLASLIGIAVGALAGFYGGWADAVAMRTIDVLLAFPGILLAITIVAVRGPGLGNVIFALLVSNWVGYARLVRGQILKVRELDFVAAARALGAPSRRVLVRHVIPNVLNPVIVQATLGLAGAILAEGSLSFLGLGIQAPQPSWGGMLNSGRGFLATAPHLTIFPGGAILVTVLGFNFLGDALIDLLDPHRREG